MTHRPADSEAFERSVIADCGVPRRTRTAASGTRPPRALHSARLSALGARATYRTVR